MDALVGASSRLTPEIFCELLHLANQPLHCISPPDLEPALHCAQVPEVVPIGMPGLKIGQEFPGGLIRVGFEMLKHFRPMRCKRVRPAASTRYRGGSVPQRAELNASSPCIVTPLSHSLCKGAELAAVPSSRILLA